jgi:ATP-dependent helicase/nuclease subunit B
LPRPDVQRAVEAIRVTAFKNYLQCPLRFYLQNICGMDDFDPEAREISNRDFGTVVHKVLEEYGNDPATKDLVDPAKVAKVLDTKLAGRTRPTRVDARPPAQLRPDSGAVPRRRMGNHRHGTRGQKNR